MNEISRRDFLNFNFQRSNQVNCGDPAFKNNEVCQDSNLRDAAESGNPKAQEWLRESAAAGDTAKCSSVFLVGGGIVGGLKWLAERRKKLALKPDNISFTQVEQ